MWKAKPVVATRVGGHRDQIEHRRSGVLVDDPADLSSFATAIDPRFRLTTRQNFIGSTAIWQNGFTQISLAQTTSDSSEASPVR